MNFSVVKKIIKKILRIDVGLQNIVTLYPLGLPAKGRALVSYLAQPATWRDDDPRFNGHSNNWESREIARILTRLGYIVDCINWNDTSFQPSDHYDIVVDIIHRLY